MDGLKTCFLVVCMLQTAFAYKCIKKSCVGTTCIPESECSANSTFGCTVSIVGDIVAQDCSNQKCLPILSNITDTSVTSDCCFAEKCNTNEMRSTENNPSVDQCYSVQCGTEGCLQEAIDTGKARMCNRAPTEKCMYTKITGDNYVETAICLETTDNICISTASYNNPEGTTTVIDCCTDNLCNSGVQEIKPGVKYCYSINCQNEGCIEEAIANNAYTICPQTELGCTTMMAMGGYTTSCSKTACNPSSFSTCCNTNLCNGPSVPTTSSTVNSISSSTTSVSTARSSSTSDPSSSTDKDTSGGETITYSLFIIYSIAIFLL